MGQPRNRLTMFLIALLIAVAAAQNNYTVLTLYSDTTCTATARTAVYSSNVTAACTPKGCTNGYAITCSTTNATFVDAGNDVCGYNSYTQGTSCPDGPVSTALRFTTSACHNVDLDDTDLDAGFRVDVQIACAQAGNGATGIKSIRTSGCTGAGSAPGTISPANLICYTSTNCANPGTTTTGTTGTTSNVTTVATTTPSPFLCRTCYQSGGVAYAPTNPFFAFCGASFLQVSVAVIGLVVAFVAAL